MDFLLIVLRLVHILGGIVWVGSAVVMFAFVGPALNATQEAGREVMGHLVQRTRFTMAMTGAALLTVLAGVALMARDASVGPGWIQSGPGMTFSIGGVFGIAGLVFGMLVGMNTAALGRVSAQMQGKPSAEQAAQIERLRSRLAILNPLNVTSLLIASLLMAVARYMVF
jgi:uncharacterized membrane protein